MVLSLARKGVRTFSFRRHPACADTAGADGRERGNGGGKKGKKYNMISIYFFNFAGK